MSGSFARWCKESLTLDVAQRICVEYALQLQLQPHARLLVDDVLMATSGSCAHRKAKGPCVVVAVSATQDERVTVDVGLVTALYAHLRPGVLPFSATRDARDIEYICDAKWLRQQRVLGPNGWPVFSERGKDPSIDDWWPVTLMGSPNRKHTHGFILAPHGTGFVLLHRCPRTMAELRN